VDSQKENEKKGSRKDAKTQRTCQTVFIVFLGGLARIIRKWSQFVNRGGCTGLTSKNANRRVAPKDSLSGRRSRRRACVKTAN